MGYNRTRQLLQESDFFFGWKGKTQRRRKDYVDYPLVEGSKSIMKYLDEKENSVRVCGHG
jgi:hypothetical protein